MITLLDVLQRMASHLEKAGIFPAKREAEELMGDVLGMKRLDLYLQFDRPLTEEELSKARTVLSRRSQGEPRQYIKGEVEFFGCSILVSPQVLIPRQETEILVDKIVKTLEKEDLKNKVFFDLCTGSGCIGIAIKKRFPNLHVVLNDLSPKALELAKKNAVLNQVEVEFFEGDFLSSLKGRRVDFIACNPPYISEAEFSSLEREVRDFEPKMALVSGKTGLEFYQRFKNWVEKVGLKACVWMEIGSLQGPDLLSFFGKGKLFQDFAGHDRFFFLEFE